VKDVTELASALKALADPVRLSILWFLADPIQSCCSRDDGVCACDFENFLGISQPTVSHHMKLLIQAGFVRGEKRGRWVYYELLPEAFDKVCRALGHFSAVGTGSKQAITRSGQAI
jgi:ArsR family transcriptional regulator